jgi:hypothetical protein
MTVLHELWYCHVAVLSFHASSSSNPPRFPCASPFLSDFRGQFWRSSGIQNGSCGISSESSRRPLSNDIKFAQIGVRTRELWLPEVGVSELFLCTFPVQIPVKRGMLSANREFHVVAGVIIFPTHPGSRIKALDILYALVKGRLVRFQFLVWLMVRSNLGQTWSTLVKLGRTWSKLSKLLEMCPGPSYWQYLMWRSVVRSCWFGSACPVLRTDTRENPVGKNGVMTARKICLTLHTGANFSIFVRTIGKIRRVIQLGLEKQ